MPVLWRHKYLGPGNKLNQGKPYDRDDAIAQKHDEDYEKATEWSDVAKADLDAINDFGVDAWNNWNWHSALGAVGLGVKHVAEKAMGPIYPSKSDMDSKRKAEERLNRESGVKMQRGDEMEAAMNTEETQAVEQQAGGGEGGGGAGGNTLGGIKDTSGGHGHQDEAGTTYSWYNKRSRSTIAPRELELLPGEWKLLFDGARTTPMEEVYPYDERLKTIATNTYTITPRMGDAICFDRLRRTFHDIVYKVEVQGAGMQIINNLAIECVWVDTLQGIPPTETDLGAELLYNNMQTFPLLGNSISDDRKIVPYYPWLKWWWPFASAVPTTSTPNWKTLNDMYYRGGEGGIWLASQANAIAGLKVPLEQRLYIRLLHLPVVSGGAATKFTVSMRYTTECWGRWKRIFRTEYITLYVAPLAIQEKLKLLHALELETQSINSIDIPIPIPFPEIKCSQQLRDEQWSLIDDRTIYKERREQLLLETLNERIERSLYTLKRKKAYIEKYGKQAV